MRTCRRILVSLAVILTAMAVHAQPTAVDMGLSVRWASCNLGADMPEGFGDYYAWGETSSKAEFTDENYLWAGNPAKYTERFILNRQLDSEDDVAQFVWGEGWRMPTFAEMNELVQNCDWVWTVQNGVAGFKITSQINGASFFLPAAGYREGGELLYAGTAGRYWTATRHPYHSNCAMDLFFSSDFHYAYFYRRFRGYPIRPVCE